MTGGGPALYVVSTPIGNLGDISHRALEVLRTADVVFAEDTRRTGKLLEHFGIETRLISAHEHNEAARARLAIDILGEGRHVALVTDAGTPLLSDPGARIVASAVAAGFPVVPIPGASALLAALVASGIATDRFTFYGFLPRRGRDRSELLAEIAASPYTVVVYESPQRVAALLADLAAAAGEDRAVAVARELTKLHEEVRREGLGAAAAYFAEHQPRGEFVVVVEGRGAGDDETDERAARTLAAALLAQGVAPSAVARELRDRLSIPRNEAYRLVQALEGET